MWCTLKKKKKENEGVGVTIYRMWLGSNKLSLKKLVVNKFISFTTHVKSIKVIENYLILLIIMI